MLTKLLHAATKPQAIALAPLEQQKLTINHSVEVTLLDPQQLRDNPYNRWI